MRLKAIILFFLIYTLIFAQENLVITEKQEFNFSIIIKTTGLRKVQPVENLVLNIKGTPYSEIKITIEDYYEITENLYIRDILLLTTKDLVLDKNGELDVEITGSLYVMEKAQSKRARERFRSPIRVEYK
ncbi:MAG: hypothetical protein ACRC8F_05120 [Cetobacterium sp.]|uniref:hypothetical protein n=1 Tax=Cetobacterium sp. TaxID=2071632 RepID=UPI003EE790F3